jgi:hypothetical protein
MVDERDIVIFVIEPGTTIGKANDTKSVRD